MIKFDFRFRVESQRPTASILTKLISFFLAAALAALAYVFWRYDPIDVLLRAYQSTKHASAAASGRAQGPDPPLIRESDLELDFRLKWARKDRNG